MSRSDSPLSSAADLKGQLNHKSRKRREKAKDSPIGQSPKRNDLLPKLQLVHVVSTAITLNLRKTRRATEAHINEVARSISQFGFVGPLMLGKDNVLIDGEVRLEAAKKLGLDPLPCIRVDHLSATEQRQLRLALNRLAEKGSWDLDELRLEFAELLELNAPVYELGFDALEIDQVILSDDVGGRDAGPLAPPPNAVPVARLGDLFLLGDHRVICGDATDPSVIDQVMAGQPEARLILTDEPYNVKVQGNVSSKAHREFAMASGEMSDEEFGSFNRKWFEAVLPHLCDGGVFGTFIDWRGLPMVLAAASAAALTQINLIIWSKTNAGMGSLYRSQHELLPLYRKGTAPIVNNVKLGSKGRWRSNVWVYPGASSLGSDARRGLQDHPTVKPKAMLEDAMADLTHRGDVVLDPFLGSGSTLIAAELCGRICCGVELEPLYVDVICKRYKAETGKLAVHSETGIPFEGLAEHRAAEAPNPQVPQLKYELFNEADPL